MILCGGLVVAESMREFQLIVVEGRSGSTRENALFRRPLWKSVPGRKTLLSSDFHMYRSLRAFKKVGLDVQPRPIPEALKRGNTWTQRWRVFVDLMIETARLSRTGCGDGSD